MAENRTGLILNTSLEPELYNKLLILIIVDALYVSAETQFSFVSKDVGVYMFRQTMFLMTVS